MKIGTNTMKSCWRGRNLSLLSTELRLQTGKFRNSTQKNVVKRQGGLLKLLLSLQ